MKTTSHLWLGLWLCLGLIACKEEPMPPQSGVMPSLQNEGFFVLNEGNFQRGNATLDYYDLITDSLISEVFTSINGRNLGDVLQSMVVADGRGFLVVNNSQKVEVVDPNTLESLATIEGLTSPRYFLPLGAGKAYVTDLYAGKVSVISLESFSISKEIDLPGWTEQLVKVGDQVWITNYNKPYLYLIDVDSDRLVDSLPVPARGEQLEVDAEGKIWLSTGPSLLDGAPGHLLRINPLSKEIEQDWVFATDQGPGELAISGNRDRIYWLNQGVYVMNITADRLPKSPLIAEDGLFYGLGVDPQRSEIYVADAIDYVQRGVILRYDPQGNLKKTFRAGIIPGAFYFRP